MDLVCIPTYNRPDYLRLCLEYISHANHKGKQIVVFVDRGKQLIREFYEVIRDFSSLDLHVTFREHHEFSGNSYNTLEAYKEAYYSDARFVYLIEDDVLITSDFFEWHESVQQQEDLMCSVAYRCSRNPARNKEYDSDPSAYLVSGQDYASIGVCWRREKLAPIIEHAKREYYANQEEYIVKRFPNNRFANCFTEQDGLIMRIMDEIDGLVAWSFVPRAYHVGFSGYHRLRGPNLSYSELKETIHNTEKIKDADRDFGDIEIVPTEPVPAWNELKCVQRFN